MTMKLQGDTLRNEIRQVMEILTKWSDLLTSGIPGDDLPANDLDIDVFQYQLRGELMLAANRLTSIVEVLE